MGPLIKPSYSRQFDRRLFRFLLLVGGAWIQTLSLLGMQRPWKPQRPLLWTSVILI